MRHIETLSEAAMIAAFLKGEIRSERFGSALEALLSRDGMGRRRVEEPDVTNEADNAYRRALLGNFRGYGQDRELFEFFPDDVAWHRYGFSPLEVASIRYIDYSYWNELSGGSRLASDAVQNVRQGRQVFGQTGERFWKAVRALERGVILPEMILVGRSADAEIVVLEGHLRLTAYLLAPEFIPGELTAIVGFSAGLTRWLALPENEL